MSFWQDPKIQEKARTGVPGKKTIVLSGAARWSSPHPTRSKQGRTRARTRTLCTHACARALLPVLEMVTILAHSFLLGWNLCFTSCAQRSISVCCVELRNRGLKIKLETTLATTFFSRGRVENMLRICWEILKIALVVNWYTTMNDLLAIGVWMQV